MVLWPGTRREKKRADILLNEVGRLGAEKADLKEGVAALRDELRLTRQAHAATTERLEHAQGVLVAVRATLAEVAVYEGMPIGEESMLLYLGEVVRDHEELERRIDLAVLECAAGREKGWMEIRPFAEQIARILQGGVATPNGVDD
jgi:hypothetical protein